MESPKTNKKKSLLFNCLYLSSAAIICYVIMYLHSERSTKHITTTKQSLKNSNFDCTNRSTAQRSILYVKTQKTASTTWKSMFFRYAQIHHLKICMNAMDKWHINWPNKVDISILTKHSSDKCELIADELMYDKEVMDDIMTRDPFLVTSVRHPVQHFLSLYNYMGIQKAAEKLAMKKLNLWDGIKLYLRYPELVVGSYLTFPESQTLPVSLMRSNLQLYSFGLNTNNKRKIEQLASTIHHFIVVEKSDESLVLLKRKLCCELKDLFYESQNVVRSDQERDLHVPTDIRRAILQFNGGDLILYNTAKKRMEKEIKNANNFYAELAVYKKNLQDYIMNCDKLQPRKKFSLLCIGKRGGYYFEQVEKMIKKDVWKKIRDDYANIERKYSKGNRRKKIFKRELGKENI